MSPGYPSKAVCSSYDKYCDNSTKIYFSPRWLVRADLDNRYTRVPAEFESGFGIRDSQVKSGRLDTAGF